MPPKSIKKKPFDVDGFIENILSCSQLIVTCSQNNIPHTIIVNLEEMFIFISPTIILDVCLINFWFSYRKEQLPQRRTNPCKLGNWSGKNGRILVSHI
jgi:hypothetical protein